MLININLAAHDANDHSTEKLPEMLRQLEQQRIKTSLQSKKAKVLYKKDLTAAGNKWNIIRTVVVATGTLIAAYSLLYPNRAKYKNRQKTELKVYPNRLGVLGLVIMGVGAVLPYKDTANLQADINHLEINTEQLQAILTTLQTKSPSSPEAATPKEERK